MVFEMFVRDLYYSLYLLCCKFSGWEGRMEAHTASLCVSAISGLFFFSICVWLELATGLALVNQWVIGTLFAVVFGADYYLFVAKDRGASFRDEFSDYSATKRALLYLFAIAFVIAVAAFAYESISAYRHAHNIVN